jgi:hypothetical protein
VKTTELLDSGPKAINVGLRSFARDLEEQQVEVVEIEWRPPAAEDEEMKRMLAELL